MILTQRILDTLKIMSKVQNSIVLDSDFHTKAPSNTVYCRSNLNLKINGQWYIEDISKFLSIAQAGDALENLGDRYLVGEKVYDAGKAIHIVSPASKLEFKKEKGIDTSKLITFYLNSELIKRIKKSKSYGRLKGSDDVLIRFISKDGELEIIACNIDEIVLASTKFDTEFDVSIGLSLMKHIEPVDSKIEIASEGALRLTGKYVSSIIALQNNPI